MFIQASYHDPFLSSLLIIFRNFIKPISCSSFVLLMIFCYCASLSSWKIRCISSKCNFLIYYHMLIPHFSFYLRKPDYALHSFTNVSVIIILCTLLLSHAVVNVMFGIVCYLPCPVQRETSSRITILGWSLWAIFYLWQWILILLLPCLF